MTPTYEQHGVTLYTGGSHPALSGTTPAYALYAKLRNRRTYIRRPAALALLICWLGSPASPAPVMPPAILQVADSRGAIPLGRPTEFTSKQTTAAVQSGMLLPRRDRKIGNPIVGVIAILVMNQFTFAERPPQVGLHDYAMFTAPMIPSPYLRAQDHVAATIQSLSGLV